VSFVLSAGGCVILSVHFFVLNYGSFWLMAAGDTCFFRNFAARREVPQVIWLNWLYGHFIVMFMIFVPAYSMTDFLKPETSCRKLISCPKAELIRVMPPCGQLAPKCNDGGGAAHMCNIQGVI